MTEEALEGGNGSEYDQNTWYTCKKINKNIIYSRKTLLSDFNLISDF